MTRLSKLSSECLTEGEKQYFKGRCDDGFKMTKNGHFCYVGNTSVNDRILNIMTFPSKKQSKLMTKYISKLITTVFTIH